MPPMLDPVLGDYARNLPDARESEVLSLFATIINKYVIFSLSSTKIVFLERNGAMVKLNNIFFVFRYKIEMIDDVPRIFEAVFQCTLVVRKFSVLQYCKSSEAS